MLLISENVTDAATMLAESSWFRSTSRWWWFEHLQFFNRITSYSSTFAVHVEVVPIWVERNPLEDRVAAEQQVLDGDLRPTGENLMDVLGLEILRLLSSSVKLFETPNWTISSASSPYTGLSLFLSTYSRMTWSSRSSCSPPRTFYALALHLWWGSRLWHSPSVQYCSPWLNHEWRSEESCRWESRQTHLVPCWTSCSLQPSHSPGPTRRSSCSGTICEQIKTFCPPSFNFGSSSWMNTSSSSTWPSLRDRAEMSHSIRFWRAFCTPSVIWLRRVPAFSWRKALQFFFWIRVLLSRWRKLVLPSSTCCPRRTSSRPSAYGPRRIRRSTTRCPGTPRRHSISWNLSW